MFSHLLASALAAPGVLDFDLKDADPSWLHPALNKRDNGLSSYDILHGRTGYYIDFELGTPPQSMRLVLDTGSSDFYVLDPHASICKTGECHQGIVFDKSKSSTFQSNSTALRAKYVDGTSANGTWAQDVMRVNGVEIDNFNFGVATSASQNVTVGGIGMPMNEAPYIEKEISTPYANFPVQLKQSGAISHVAYSLWLGNTDGKLGKILFGGLDTTRYIGDIYTFPMVDSFSGSIDFAIKMDGMYLITPDGEQQPLVDTALPVIFDSGTTITSFPFEVIQPLLVALNAQEIEGQYLVPCSTLSQGGGVGLVFSGIEYVFNFRDIVVPLAAGYCYPGFDVIGSSPLIGDNILRTLYVIYDLENYEIGLAFANTDASLSTVSPSYQAFSTGIPGTQAPRYSESDLNFQTVNPYSATFYVGNNAQQYAESASFVDKLSIIDAVATTGLDTTLVGTATTVTSAFDASFNTGVSTILGSLEGTGLPMLYTSTYPVPTATPISGGTTATNKGITTSAETVAATTAANTNTAATTAANTNTAATTAASSSASTSSKSKNAAPQLIGYGLGGVALCNLALLI